jgi:hypothetical protein
MLTSPMSTPEEVELLRRLLTVVLGRLDLLPRRHGGQLVSGAW